MDEATTTTTGAADPDTARNDTIHVSRIVVGDRARVGAPDIHTLAKSIHAIGLLHPVVINTRNELIAGFRRLQALKHLGWEDIPVRRAYLLDDAVWALRAEREENLCRVDLTPSELASLGKKIEALERPAAKERLKEAGKAGGKGSGKLPEASKGDTRDKVAAALGVSGRTYEKAKQVQAAADADPVRYGDLPAMMDSKSIDAAHREMKERAADANVASARPEATLPEPIARAMSARERFEEAARLADRLSRLVNDLGNEYGGYFFRHAIRKDGMETVPIITAEPVTGGGCTGKIRYRHRGLDELRRTLRAAAPKGPCAAKFPGESHGDCPGCAGQGWIPRDGDVRGNAQGTQLVLTDLDVFEIDQPADRSDSA